MGVRYIQFQWLLAASCLTPVVIMAGERGADLPAPMVRIDPTAYHCEDYLPQARHGNTEWDMMETEHCDRIQRLAALTRTGAQPEFFVQRIPKERLPAGFRQDVPMLRVVFPDRVFFDTAQATLRPEGMEVVRIVAESLRNDVPDVTLFVAGHTDPRGARDYNQNLSVDRANSVAAEILRQGMNVATVWRIGFGEDMPLVPNIDEAAWGYNRRVEFLFAAKPEAIAAWLADMQLDNLCSGASRSETDGCKRTLELRSDYRAEKLVIVRHGMSVAPHRTTGVVAPISGHTAMIDQPGQAQVRVDPRARGIVLDPVNRTFAIAPIISGEKR